MHRAHGDDMGIYYMHHKSGEAATPAVSWEATNNLQPLTRAMQYWTPTLADKIGMISAYPKSCPAGYLCGVVVPDGLSTTVVAFVVVSLTIR